MSLVELIASVSLGVSIVNLVLYYRFSSKSSKPAINHFLKNLPPYKSPKETTEIKIKNEGTAQARLRSVFLNFSWDKDFQVVLFDEKDLEYGIITLGPNEEVTYYKTLPEPPFGEKEYIKITTVFDNNIEKEQVFELGMRIQKSFG